ncbi:nucleoside hydrolase [Mucilaginibacter flavidus]|uniref:nucleoside hydrolase n=1 Tax=Mucilaginibacter flavidus TaxID=2949309 RepID=UPI0020932535|nr:nucleoside hydrolase [Mucilaginibacter flavidus]MCO5949414.1 nucleoside hydrolase [Mucilaginibacter flavidus]
MKLKSALYVLFICCAINAFSQTKPARVNIIFDSDMGPDYDDVGAITILHALADKGEAKILATIASTKYEGVAGVLNVFNTYFNRPNIPIGVPKGDAQDLRDFQHWTDTLLAKYPHKIKTNAEAADAVTLYRKILALQPDNSVTIVTVGFLTNLSNLLNTTADGYSSLTGKELVKRKVKLLVSMGGKFPSGYEFNIMKDAPASKNVYDNWGTPVIFSGFEIGVKIKAGLPLIGNASIKNSPVKDVFKLSIPMAKEDSLGRCSWDETAVLIAIKGYGQWYTLHKGKITVATDGSNGWDEGGTNQAYIIEKVDYKVVQDIINTLLMHQPAGKIIHRKTTGSSLMTGSTSDRIAKIEALNRKIDKIEANINRREKEIARAEKSN